MCVCTSKKKKERKKEKRKPPFTCEREKSDKGNIKS